MADATAPGPFEGAGEMRDENARLLEEMDLDVEIEKLREAAFGVPGARVG